MKLLEPTSTVTTVSFHGAQVHEILAANPMMLNAVWKRCSGKIDATIKCHVNPRVSDYEPLVWALDISSPTGRRTLAVTQRRTGSDVTFSNQ